MPQPIIEQAKQLAQRPYQIVVADDETTEGTPAFLAVVSELPNCVGQGTTVEEALEDAQLAMIDYIVSLLEDGVKVPEPFEQLPVSVSSVAPLHFLPKQQPKKEGANDPRILETERPNYVRPGQLVPLAA